MQIHEIYPSNYCQTPNGLPTGFELCFPMEWQQSPPPKSNVSRVARQLSFIMQPRFYLTKRFMPWCTILYRFGGNFCEKNIPQFFCKKIDCGLWLRHGIMSLFNAQPSFVELEVIFRGVKNSGNQKFNKRHYEILSHLMNCQTIDRLYKTVLRLKKIFLC